MKLLVTSRSADRFYTDPIGIPVFSDRKPPHREAGVIDFRLAGAISRYIENGDVDTASPSPTMFTPASEGAFPGVVITGAGAFSELSTSATEDAIAGLTCVLIKTGEPVFGLAARDFRKERIPVRDSAEIVLRGIAKGCERADIFTDRTIRVHWDADEADLMVQELKRFRHHLPPCKGWEVEKAPEDTAV